jgi:glycosyltransferase involved in cell wall biosynthesis
MNILIVTQYFYPERFLINSLAEDLNKAGHCVSILTGMPNYPAGKVFPGYRCTFPTRERYNEIEIIRVPIIPRGSASRFRLLANYLSYVLSASLFAPFLLRRPVDVIFVYQLSPVFVGIPALVVKWMKHAPILLWVQDLWPESLIATGAIKSPILLATVRGLVRLIYRWSDIILVQSQAFIPKIRELAPRAGRIRFLPNPADRLYRPVVPLADAPERTMMRPGFRVLFAGNMGVAQDLENVLAAAERLGPRRDIQWVLIGDGRVRPWVEEQIQARGLEKTVQVLGPFDSERMPTFFALADALLVTLRREDIFALTIPSKLQSYLACGRPIIAALEGEGARIVTEANAGLTCPPSDSAALAAAVERMHESPTAERTAMGKSGRRYFVREFDRDVLIERLQGCLEDAQRGYR